MTETATTARPRPQALAPDQAVMAERKIPFNEGAEAALIGSLFLDAREFDNTLSIVSSASMFWHEKNQILFTEMLAMFEQSREIDGVLLLGRLQEKKLLAVAGGIEYLTEVASSLPSAAHAVSYANQVRDSFDRRELIRAASATLNDAYDSKDTVELLKDRAQSRFFGATEQRVESQAPLAEVIQRYMEHRDSEGGYVGIPTGWPEVDELVPGLRNGEMVVVAGRPGTGKTAFALNIIQHNCQFRQRPCGMFNLEMSELQLCERLTSTVSNVDGWKLRRRMLSSENAQSVAHSAVEMSNWPMFLDFTPGLSISDLRSRARKMVKSFHCELLVVDYLQLMEGGGSNRQEQVSSISRGIKSLARELNIPVIALSQLNRASESEKRLPRTSDLRESGSLEQDADIVFLLHREALMHLGEQEWIDANFGKLNDAKVIIAKQRNGPVGDVVLTWDGEITSFHSRKMGAP